jgi:hypothetical protein
MERRVSITTRESVCDECGEGLGHYAWIALVDGKAYCLSCADLDHLIFLPAGDAALTRRSAKYSRLSAVVLKWSRARKRCERQGLLVEESALQRAERECLADEEVRARRREREAKRRAIPGNNLVLIECAYDLIVRVRAGKNIHLAACNTT